jgi:hypothetical protein
MAFKPFLLSHGWIKLAPLWPKAEASLMNAKGLDKRSCLRDSRVAIIIEMGLDTVHCLLCLAEPVGSNKDGCF